MGRKRAFGTRGPCVIMISLEVYSETGLYKQLYSRDPRDVINTSTAPVFYAMAIPYHTHTHTHLVLSTLWGIEMVWQHCQQDYRLTSTNCLSQEGIHNITTNGQL